MVYKILGSGCWYTINNKNNNFVSLFSFVYFVKCAKKAIG